MLKRYQSAVVLASEFLSCHFIHILSSWGDAKAFPRQCLICVLEQCLNSLMHEL